MTAALPHCFLFDNGSLRPDATINLRQIAQALAGEIGVPVQPVSLLHSSGVDPASLEGERAQLLEPALAELLTRESSAQAILLPLFFGPSAALTEYVPERLRRLKERFPQASLTLAASLCPDPERAEHDVVEALAEAAEGTLAGLDRPPAILVDHGSPQRAVARVRDVLAEALARRLGGRVRGVFPASMERKPGAEFAFNDPLLEQSLTMEPTNAGDVLLIQQFLSPGRHAGEGGDIAQICQAAMASNPHLRIHISPTIGRSRHIRQLLARRWNEALATLPSPSGHKKTPV